MVLLFMKKVFVIILGCSYMFGVVKFVTPSILRFQCWMELGSSLISCSVLDVIMFQVDSHIQQLDQYLKKSGEELRRERENTATASPTQTPDGTTKSGRSGESGRGGRKKTRLATAAAATEVAASAANPTGVELDLPVDPNEPTYCLCNQVSYGEMVACDNPNCKIEWFHFGCVGLKEQPKGKWYCPDCATVKNRRKGR
uniref:PHD-type domain-containing protein n=1 Tax=Gossypium raimondii TaxID=29730 RepID=A0A0D2R878_GOSRA|nr:hypothetical protein B456_005G039000 [Gossypium raimondii]